MSAEDTAAAAAPLSARGEQRRRAVLRHTVELFDARGYHRTQMSEIAAAAGIRKTTLYHYFRLQGRDPLLDPRRVHRVADREPGRRRPHPVGTG